MISPRFFGGIGVALQDGLHDRSMFHRATVPKLGLGHRSRGKVQELAIPKTLRNTLQL
jgi:hypothetical protein